jgi:hypothetical protein
MGYIDGIALVENPNDLHFLWVARISRFIRVRATPARQRRLRK